MFCLSYWGNCLSVWLVKAKLVSKSVCIWLLSQKSWCKDLASFVWVIRSQTLYYKPLFQVLHSPNNNKRCGSLYPQNPILKSKLKPSQCHRKLPTVTHTYYCLTDHPKLSSPRKDACCLLSLACPEPSGGSDARSWMVVLTSPGSGHQASVVQQLVWGWTVEFPCPGSALAAGRAAPHWLSPCSVERLRASSCSGFPEGQSGSPRASWDLDEESDTSVSCVLKRARWLAKNSGSTCWWRSHGHTACVESRGCSDQLCK